MKDYLVQELWGSIFSDDIPIKANNNQDCIKKYLKHRNILKRAVYDSKKNHIQNSSQVICVQKARIEGDIRYISGKRYFYKLVD